MSKCCCDLFKIHKKTSNCVVTCYHKSFSTASLQCLTRKREETMCPLSSAERKSCKCQGKCQLNRSSPVPPHKKNWKAMTQYESLLRELAHQTWARVFFGRLSRFILCHCFSEHWSFFPFSSETLEYRCRYTFLIAHINAVTFFLCILNGSQHTHFFHPCHYSMARLAALWLIPMGSMAMSPSSTLWSVAFIWYALHC